jgi:hypothetical protein
MLRLPSSALPSKLGVRFRINRYAAQSVLQLTDQLGKSFTLFVGSAAARRFSDQHFALLPTARTPSPPPRNIHVRYSRYVF